MTLDLWERLARLDRCCRVVVMCRFVGTERSGWVVRVSPREKPEARPIIVEGDLLPEALAEVVAQAEALGWLPAGTDAAEDTLRTSVRHEHAPSPRDAQYQETLPRSSVAGSSIRPTA